MQPKRFSSSPPSSPSVTMVKRLRSNHSSSSSPEASASLDTMGTSASSPPPADDLEYSFPPSSPAGPVPEADHTYHVFQSYGPLYPQKSASYKDYAPCGVFGTLWNANEHAKSILEEAGCDEWQMQCAFHTTKHGLADIRWVDREVDRWYHVSVNSRRWDSNQEAQVWALWVTGEMRGAYATEVAAAKGVERERVKLKDQRAAEGVVQCYLIESDGLEVKSFREDGGEEIVIKAVPWDLMT